MTSYICILLYIWYILQCMIDGVHDHRIPDVRLHPRPLRPPVQVMCINYMIHHVCILHFSNSIYKLSSIFLRCIIYTHICQYTYNCDLYIHYHCIIRQHDGPSHPRSATSPGSLARLLHPLLRHCSPLPRESCVCVSECVCARERVCD